jgi:hypothetical protein
MIRLAARPITSLADAYAQMQIAINLELATLPVYLYAKFSILAGTNEQAVADFTAIAHEEMSHLCLACNILNAIGGNPVLQPLKYPSAFPGDIGPPGGAPIVAHLLRFSEAAIDQGMAIEQPVKPIPVVEGAFLAAVTTETIGQFYAKLDAYLSGLPANAWHKDRNQIRDTQFFPGQIYRVSDYASAHHAISQIVSQGEGTPDVPLDFENELAHYYRFWSLKMGKQITKGKTKGSYVWGSAIVVDYNAVHPAIADPSAHDFSKESPEARSVQDACNEAYTKLIDALQLAFSGDPDQMGTAVRAMFDLRKSALAALAIPLASGDVAGPAFIYSKAAIGGAP